MPQNLLHGQKPLVLVTHNESIFNANDGKRQLWMKDGKQPLMVPRLFLTPGGRLAVPNTIAEADGGLGAERCLVRRGHGNGGLSGEGGFRTGGRRHGTKDMFRPIRERCPFANMNVPFANILSRSRVGSCLRTGRISANTLNTLHGYG